ncbi:MAG: hypothetical protein WCJ17_03360 [bacterium]
MDLILYFIVSMCILGNSGVLLCSDTATVSERTSSSIGSDGTLFAECELLAPLGGDSEATKEQKETLVASLVSRINVESHGIRSELGARAQQLVDDAFEMAEEKEEFYLWEVVIALVSVQCAPMITHLSSDFSLISMLCMASAGCIPMKSVGYVKQLVDVLIQQGNSAYIQHVLCMDGLEGEHEETPLFSVFKAVRLIKRCSDRLLLDLPHATDLCADNGVTLFLNDRRFNVHVLDSSALGSLKAQCGLMITTLREVGPIRVQKAQFDYIRLILETARVLCIKFSEESLVIPEELSLIQQLSGGPMSEGWEALCGTNEGSRMISEIETYIVGL